MKKTRFQKKGYVLVYVILTIILAGILAASLYSAVFLTNKLFIQVQYGKSAYYIAVTGVEYGRYMIKSDHYDFSSSPLWFLVLSNGEVTVRIQRFGAGTQGDPYTYSITSASIFFGATPAVTRTITVSCTATGSITSWQ